jgi:hypothetical protein
MAVVISSASLSPFPNPLSVNGLAELQLDGDQRGRFIFLDWISSGRLLGLSLHGPNTQF